MLPPVPAFSNADKQRVCLRGGRLPPQTAEHVLQGGGVLLFRRRWAEFPEGA